MEKFEYKGGGCVSLLRTKGESVLGTEVNGRMGKDPRESVRTPVAPSNTHYSTHATLHQYVHSF